MYTTHKIIELQPDLDERSPERYHFILDDEIKGITHHGWLKKVNNYIPKVSDEVKLLQLGTYVDEIWINGIKMIV